MINKQEIENLYKSSGYSTDSVRRWIKQQDHKGFDESFDGSLLIVYFTDFSVVITCSRVEFLG